MTVALSPALLAVAGGGALGAVLRHLFGMLALRLLGPGLPWGTLGVNIIGGLAMGMIVEWLALRGGLGESVRLFLTTGLLGGFTTFSAFSLEVTGMLARNDHALAAGYAATSVILSVGAVFAGMALVRGLAG